MIHFGNLLCEDVYMKPRNLVIFGTEEQLKELEIEYRMIGFYVKRTPEFLTIFTRPRKRKEKKRRKTYTNNKSRNN